MKISTGTEEVRIRIHISEYQKYIIESDIQNFDLSCSWQAFVNQLICEYYEYADCSTFIHNKKNRDNIIELLKNIKLSPEQKETIAKCIYPDNAYAEKVNFSVRAPSQVFRPSSSLIKNVEDSGHKVDVLDGKYVDALVYEYTHKPYDARERIFKRKIFNIIESAIKNNTSLILDTNKRKYHILPYAIVQSTTAVYSYLICKSAKLDSNRVVIGDYKPACFRLSYISLSHIEALESDNERFKRKLETKDKKDLKKIMGERNIQFFTSEVEEFKIKLTDKGISEYKKRIHLRPPYANAEECETGGKIYTFNCSEDQIEAYFFKFGADAEILSPLKTHKKFQKKYKEAAELYSK